MSDAAKLSWAAELHGDKVTKLRTDIASDTYKPLKSAYNRYVFWKGEQERLASLIVAEQAYYNLATLEAKSEPTSK